MTPIERIRRNRDMIDLSREMTQPTPMVRDFPRNPTGLALLLLTVLPLVVKAIIDPSTANILGYGGCTLGFGLGLFSLAHGQKLRAIYDSKRVAKTAPIPFKIAGSVILGVTAAALTVFQGGSYAQAGAVLPVVAGLSVISFGRDPRRHKGLTTTSERHGYKMEKMAAEVGVQLDRIKKSAGVLAVPEVMAQIRALDDGISALLNAVTQDPERAASVRKHFTVYIGAAADASERFAGVYSGTGDIAAKNAYVALLAKLAATFTQEAQDYAAAGTSKLEIELKVLNSYLDNAA